MRHLIEEKRDGAKVPLFKKPQKDKKEYLYKCSKCGDEDWYWMDLPPHMLLGHYKTSTLRRCDGSLALIETRELQW